MIQWNPGVAKRWYLPNRSISPRCVGRMIRTPEMKKKTANATIAATAVIEEPIKIPFQIE